MRFSTTVQGKTRLDSVKDIVLKRKTTLAHNEAETFYGSD